MARSALRRHFGLVLWPCLSLPAAGCFDPTETGSNGDEGSSDSGTVGTTAPTTSVGSEPTTTTASTTTASTTMTADDTNGSESVGTEPTGGTDSGTDDGTTGPMAACGDGLFADDAPPLGDAELVTTLTNAFSVTIADVNDDDVADLLVGDLGDDNPSAGVYFLRAIGAGAFAAPVKLPGGAFLTFGVAAGAISDDAVDVVAAGAFPTGPKDFVDAVYVWRGNGDGTFGAPVALTALSDRDIDMFDLDANDRLDLIATGGPGVSVALASPAEAFPDADVFGGVPAVEAAKGTDLDGDGSGDIVYLTTTGVAVLLGDGTGVFGDATEFDLGLNGPSDLALGDFDGDGDVDVAAGLSDSIFVLAGDGSGGLAEPIEAIAGSAISSVVATDFDGDGCDDLAAVDAGLQNVATLMGRDDLAFGDAPVFDIDASAAPFDVAAGDLDGDAISDLAIVVPGGGPSGGEVLVLLSNG